MNEPICKIIRKDNSDSGGELINIGMRRQLEWMQRQVEYLMFSQKYAIRMACRRGEIYEIDWGINLNAEFSNRHYGIVLMDSQENNPLVLICPLKTNKNGPNKNSDIDLGVIKELNTDHKTLAVFNQIRTIDKIRIYKNRLIGFRDNTGLSEKVEQTSSYSVPKVSYKVVDDILDAYFHMIDSH